MIKSKRLKPLVQQRSFAELHKKLFNVDDFYIHDHAFDDSRIQQQGDSFSVNDIDGTITTINLQGM